MLAVIYVIGAVFIFLWLLLAENVKDVATVIAAITIAVFWPPVLMAGIIYKQFRR